MTTTETPTAPLPFLIPAANLAIGDVIFQGSTVATVEITSDLVRVEFTDKCRTAFYPDTLVEVSRRSPIAMRNTLCELAQKWERQAVSDEETGDATRLMMAGVLRRVSGELRDLLGRMA